MITLDKVRSETLEQRLSKLPDGNLFFNEINNYVNAHLFSRYPERREFALRELNNMMRERVKGVTRVDIHTLEQKGIIYVYLSANSQDLYSFVAAYNSESPVFEVEPTAEERKRWAAEKH